MTSLLPASVFCRSWRLTLISLFLVANGGVAHESRALKEEQSAVLRAFLGGLFRLEREIGSFQSDSARGKAAPPTRGASLGALRLHAAASSAALEPLTLRVGEARTAPVQERLSRLQALLAPPELSEVMAVEAYRQARALRQVAWAAFQVDAVPTQGPKLPVAQSVYGVHCQNCHGSQGAGDGVLAGKIPIPVGSFQAESFQTTAAPIMIYHTLLDGMGPGSPMPAFKQQLTSDELWSLSYYVLALAQGSDRAAPAPGALASGGLTASQQAWLASLGLTLSGLAQRSDYELRDYLQVQAGRRYGELCGESRCRSLVAYLRQQATFEGKLPR